MNLIISKEGEYIDPESGEPFSGSFFTEIDEEAGKKYGAMTHEEIQFLLGMDPTPKIVSEKLNILNGKIQERIWERADGSREIKKFIYCSECGTFEFKTTFFPDNKKKSFLSLLNDQPFGFSKDWNLDGTIHDIWIFGFPKPKNCPFS